MGASLCDHGGDMSYLRRLICPTQNSGRDRVYRKFNKEYNAFSHVGNAFMTGLANDVVDEAFLPYIIDRKEDWHHRYVQLLLGYGREKEEIENITYKRYYHWASEIMGSRYGIRRIESMAPEYAYCHADLDIGRIITERKYEYTRKSFSVIWVNIPDSFIISQSGFLDDFFYDYLGRLICRVFWHRRTKGNVKLFTEHVRATITPEELLSKRRIKPFTIPCLPERPCRDIVRLVITENV